MLTLAIDTSCAVVRAAICGDKDGHHYMEKAEIPDAHDASAKLLPLIKCLVSSCGLDMCDVDLIAVVNGPGSYTGLRVAAVTAKSIAYAYELPVVGVNTLDGLYFSYRDIARERDSKLVVPLIDARNARCYGAVYDPYANGTLGRLTDYFVRDCKVIADHVCMIQQKSVFQGEILLCGNGVLRDENVGAFYQTEEDPLYIYVPDDCCGNIFEVALYAAELYEVTPDKSVFDQQNLVINYMKEWI